MAEITITSFVRDKLDELVLTLYNEGYFAFMESSEDYVKKIYRFLNTIHQLQHYPAKITTHGLWYCRYKPNRHTSWYATFDKENDFYIIRNVVNNHDKDYPVFIKGLNEK